MPTLEDASQLLRVLARSATGQDMSVYTTLSTGPRRAGDPDGPEEYHVILLDNGRSAMLGGDFEDMLRCIRCGACMNHCPVYQAVGGHAYGSVYPGPMGAVLTPSLVGVAQGGQLPNASTFCGRCEAVCPVRIPLPNMMRHWREREFERRLSPATMRYGVGFWAFFAKRPALYRLSTDFAMRALHWFGRAKGRFSSLPFAGGWTRYRDLPAPQGATFQSRWRARSGRVDLSARDAIFANIRRSLNVTGAEAPRRMAVADRLAAAPAGVIPERGQGDAAMRAATFKAEAERAQASVAEVDSAADVPGEIARFLRDGNLPALVRMGDDPRLAAMPWSATALEIAHGPSDGHDLNAVSAAFAAVAESGTLALASGPDNPTTLNFLPDNHLVVVAASDIVADYETVWTKLRARYGKGVMPRTLNLITGPSRSADIEQTLLLGAHGPRRLHIVIVRQA